MPGMVKIRNDIMKIRVVIRLVEYIRIPGKIMNDRYIFTVCLVDSIFIVRYFHNIPEVFDA
jgi:hypothetical protein